MEDRVIIIATSKLIEGQLPQLQEVIKELQAHCINTEEGMLQYDWYVSEDSSTIKVLETYVNAEAVLFHFDNYKSFASRLGEFREFVSLEVYGKASEELRQKVKKINAEHFMLVSGLNKLRQH
ncbi:antibiotic biosynthesis monooxygenase [uncultured Microscilla sp.]|uniref:putative quinol monooxygenase n=1 Tax=uncultured Microscilla sp. TaxID=432653 RepID=UPI0026328A14|nr:antibiotic biosynthesis monooxygenase [uncultured Microscilla sp.]